ncbi:MAG: type II toxin-antitoxin system Phd/YefM family antitoxin [Terriglobales bacterium]
MRAVQASEAKTHLPRLLDEVERGASIIITRHGRPIARIVPEAGRRRGEIAAAMARIRTRRKTAPRIRVAELIAGKNQGRM